MGYDKKYNKNNWQKKEAKSYKEKRGKLAPLMTEEAKSTASIHELSYDFACRITRLFQFLTEDAEYKEFVSSKQVYRSEPALEQMCVNQSMHNRMQIS